MGSRARTAAAACLVAGGVWAGTAGVPTALADPADSATGGGVADGRADHRPDVPSRATGKHGRNETESDIETDAGAGAAVAEQAGPAATDPREEEIADEDTAGQNAAAAAQEEPSPPPCRDGRKNCGPGWPWPWSWPWPDDDPDPPGGPNPSTGGSSSDRPVGVPRPGGPPSPGAGVPAVRPPEDLPFDPDVIDTVPGVGLPAAGEAAPISVPVLTAPVAAGTGGVATSSGSGAGTPAAPRQAPREPPPVRQPPAAPEVAPGPRVAPPSRLGYGETLRKAGTSQLAALAIPGVAGILVLTALGGLLGYRQARAGQAMRARGTARFMN